MSSSRHFISQTKSNPSTTPAIFQELLFPSRGTLERRYDPQGTSYSVRPSRKILLYLKIIGISSAQEERRQVHIYHQKMASVVRQTFPSTISLLNHLMIRIGDTFQPPNELQPFLRTTLVCGPQVALPSCHRRQDDTTSSTMLGVLESVIKSLVSGSESNILAAGFRLRRAHDIGMCSLQMLESFFPNTLLNYLKSWEWDTLLTHVVRNITA